MTDSLDPLLDNAPCGFLSIDAAGMVRIANGTLARLVDLPRAQIEGQSLENLLSPAGRIFYNTHLFPLLKLHGRADEVYVPLRRADGAALPVLVNGAARKQDGDVAYDLVVVPMGQRNELERELIAARNVAVEAAAAKDRFLAIVSHELRAPLTAVRGYADLLLRDSKSMTRKQRTYVTHISESAQYQARLIEDILDFASLEHRRDLEQSRLEVEDVVARAVALLSIRAAEEARTLRREPAAAKGAMIADERAVQQILLNLGINAIKFSPSDREVVFGSKARGDRVEISVQDAGSGIPAGEMEHIFEPFVQLGAPEHGAPSRGVGLGLSISRELARSMGGDITVASAPGAGSTFTVSLPRAR